MPKNYLTRKQAMERLEVTLPTFLAIEEAYGLRAIRNDENVDLYLEDAIMAISTSSNTVEGVVSTKARILEIQG